MITFDKENNSYIIGRSDGEKIEFKVTDIIVSKANSASESTQSATITMDALSIETEKLAAISLEIRTNSLHTEIEINIFKW